MENKITDNTHELSNKKKLKGVALLLTLLLAAALLMPVPANAATKYTGTYMKVWKTSSPYRTTEINPSYAVTINKLKKKKAILQISYCGVNGSPLYETKIITAKRSGKKLTFKWEDSWCNKGKGTIKLYKGYLKIKMKQTYTAKWNRSTLRTKGYMKIKKKNNKTKLYKWYDN